MPTLVDQQWATGSANRQAAAPAVVVAAPAAPAGVPISTLERCMRAKAKASPPSEVPASSADTLVLHQAEQLKMQQAREACVRAAISQHRHKKRRKPAK